MWLEVSFIKWWPLWVKVYGSCGSNLCVVSVSGWWRAVWPAHAWLHPRAAHQEHEGPASPSVREEPELQQRQGQQPPVWTQLLGIQSGLHGGCWELCDPAGVSLLSSPQQQFQQRSGPRSGSFFDFTAPPWGEEDLEWWASGGSSSSRRRRGWSPSPPPLPAVPSPNSGRRVGAGRAAQTHPRGQRVGDRRHQGSHLYLLVLPVPRSLLLLWRT